MAIIKNSLGELWYWLLASISMFLIVASAYGTFAIFKRAWTKATEWAGRN